MSKNKSLIDLKAVSLKFIKYGEFNNRNNMSFFRRLLRSQHTKRTEFWIFRDLSLKINEGERVGIVGSNGAGKSTLLKIIAGIYPPTKGVVRVVGNLSPLIGLGTGVNHQLSGAENVILMGTMMGIKAEEMKARLKKILDFAGLADFAETPVKYYSSGMRQRLAFSTVSEITPDILLSDEVFAGGDAQFQNKAKKRIWNHIDQASIFILVSHSLSIIEEVTNRTIWIEKGKIVADGLTADVLKAYEKFNGKNSNLKK